MHSGAKVAEKAYEQGADTNPSITFVPLLNKRNRGILVFLITVWFISLVLFLDFWIQKSNIISGWRYLVNSLVLVYTFIMPGYLYFFLLKMKKVNYQGEIPKSWRVAMVVTKAPSEPFRVVKKTLEAMLKQKFPHDTWLADEDPTPEVRNWCKKHGVYISTRKNVPEYHQAQWPRRTKCKEGNLAYFYDMYGYQSYDFVAQLDADHIPGRNYLEEMLKPFLLDDVGYVSAPSICNSNEKTSWAARGRLYAEGIMHGPLQAGYTYHYAPLCIGSHYAVRTRALREIGGLGPELAEDHSTTLLFNSAGWKGVHAIDAIASGEGPQTLQDMLIQEYQWSRSLTILLFTLLPKHWSRLTPKMRIQFLFSELWYPVYGFTMLLGYLLPVVSIFSNSPWVNVSFFEFLSYSIPLACSLLAITYFLKLNNLMRPINCPIFSWEMALFNFVRWPWALYGVIVGAITGIAGINPDFLVTKKGEKVGDSLSPNTLLVLASIMLMSFLPYFHYSTSSSVYGYFFFLIMNLCIFSLVIISVILLHRKEAIKYNKLVDEEL